MHAKALMVGGTASHVGKSWMATAICRWLYHEGVKVAPFKAQNMSNNSYPCTEGGEIGRAQVAQAQACGLEPSADMNPVLLKPSSDVGSQVVVHGKVWRNLSARSYYEQCGFLREKVRESFLRLASRFEFIVIEGAGSVAELNLRQSDIVNFGFVSQFKIPVLLVADIDRGGVFASLYGTVALLKPSERKLVRAFAINRFRGDPTLFSDGAKLIERKTGRPCLGVFPFDPSIDLDQEDSVDLDAHHVTEGSKVAIIRFPHISNHTDFRLLRDSCWIRDPDYRKFEVLILPGTKSTMSDLEWLRRRGLEPWLRWQHDQGAKILGICGGYQMLGICVRDPEHVESPIDAMNGLGLLPVLTTLRAKKVTRAVTAWTKSGASFTAYEIHMGETVPVREEDHFASVDGRTEGMCCNGCIGTYLHGALESAVVLREYLSLEVSPAPNREEVYDRLAEWFADAADIELFRKCFLG